MPEYGWSITNILVQLKLGIDTSIMLHFGIGTEKVYGSPGRKLRPSHTQNRAQSLTSSHNHKGCACGMATANRQGRERA